MFHDAHAVYPVPALHQVALTHARGQYFD